MIISFHDWTGSTRWYNLLVCALQIRLERVFIRGYKWTPFCVIKSVKFISHKKREELSKEAMDKVT